ncbi:MAG: YHS domain-containing protein [Elusimicrobiales bacterium]|nr:YHS domain-containing protein [Elusimicrobiales bacterium]
MKLLNAMIISAMLAGTAAAAENKPAADAWKTRTFTAEELKQYNGKDGKPVYAAVDGIVYDLSGSKYWKTGRHMKLHDAGTDLSSDIHNKAPKAIHRDGKILEGMPKVGVMKETAVAKPLVAIHKVAAAEVGQDASCPVTRKKLKITEKTPALDFKGKTYYFAGDAALEAFRAAPDKYLGGMGDKVKNLFKKKS